jgi:hypothetical protein
VAVVAAVVVVAVVVDSQVSIEVVTTDYSEARDLKDRNLFSIRWRFRS